MKHLISFLFAAGLSLAVTAGTASADLKVGDEAKLQKSVDESLQPVDMADLVDGKPLVLVVGSCS